jgi:hypothetical protein
MTRLDRRGALYLTFMAIAILLPLLSTGASGCGRFGSGCGIEAGAAIGPGRSPEKIRKIRARVCLQLRDFFTRTDQNQRRNAVLSWGFQISC